MKINLLLINFCFCSYFYFHQRNNVPILRGFPIDRLNEFPHAIQHCNYGYNSYFKDRTMLTLINQLFRQSEVVARDSRLMKHIFIVKTGSVEVWKCLNPNGHIPKLSKHDMDHIKNEKC